MPEGRPGFLRLPIARRFDLSQAEDKDFTGSCQHPNNCTMGPHKEQLDTQEAKNELTVLLFSKGLPLRAAE